MNQSSSSGSKPIQIVAHIHSLKFEYLFGEADTEEQAQEMIEDFFGPDPDPEVVTIRLESQ